MAEQALWPKQPVVLVDVGIVARPRIELLREGDLGVVLREMRLHVAVRMLGEQRAGHLHLLRRRGDGEARRDGVERTALAVPGDDQRLGVVVAGLRRVAKPLRRIAVHHHLAADDQHVALGCLREEGFGQFLVHRAIGSDRGRALPHHLVEEQPRDAAAMLRVEELGLLRKRVGVQPVEQLGAVGGDDLHLREMHMRVDEARQDEVRPVVDGRDIGAGLPRHIGIAADRGDLAVTDEHRAILLVAIGGAVAGAVGPAQERQRPAAEKQIGHLTSALPRTRRRSARVPPA